MRGWFLVALLVGCEPTQPEPTGTSTGTATSCDTPTAWFADTDNDGFGDPNALTTACVEPVRHVTDATDCDDTDPLVHPDAPDRTCDGLDQNCNGTPDDEADYTTWYADADGDGVGGTVEQLDCQQPPGFVEFGGDCDDGDDTVFPTAPELCNGVDDDCDLDIPLEELDVDGDGYRVCEGDCDDTDSYRYPGQFEICNRVDDDCDLAIPYDEFDLDGDGQTPCEGDCDDSDPFIFQGGIEVIANGIDGDCDGFELCYLDADGDGVGTLASVFSPDLACDATNESAQWDDCDDTDPLVFPGGVELPWDGVDNDCDPVTVDDDVDADGWLNVDDCDDLDPTVNPGVIEPIVFTDVTVGAGLWVTSWDAVLYPPVCGSEGMSGSGSAADFDGDGWTDLFVPRQHEPDQLFRNQGDGTFVDVASAWGINHTGMSSLGVFFDMDADADLDLLVVSHGTEGNRLYRNEGTTFVEVAGAGGMEMPLGPYVICSLVYGASAADIDQDGDIDIHTSQWHGLPGGFGDRSRVWLNDGTGNFTDGTVASGIDLSYRAAFASNFGDLDDDGILDVAVASDWMESGLWMGSGSGVFVETTATAGVGLDENGMGSDLGDYDGDGDLDWFVTAIYDDFTPVCPINNWNCAGNFLYQNNGDGTFTDATDTAGVRDGEWGWGAAFLDYDNDGDLDLGMTNGFHLDSVWEDDTIKLWDNDGTGVFDDRACQMGIDLPGEGKGFVTLDFDNDGDLDVFTTLTGAEPRLYRNDGGDTNSWLIVHASEPGNPYGLGAKVWVEPAMGGAVMRRDIHANSTFMGIRAPEAHFGLGSHEASIYEIRVEWLDGTVTAVQATSPRQVVTIQR